MLCLITAWPPPSHGDGSLSREQKIKAAIVYKLAKFVEWPDSTFTDRSAPMKICMLGQDPIKSALTAVAGKIVQGRKIAFQQHTKLPEHGCHIVFISSSQQGQLAALVQRLQGQPILTISDIERFAHEGGVVGLVRKKNRISFEINLDAATQAGLSFSATLLELATVVRRGH